MDSPSTETQLAASPASLEDRFAQLERRVGELEAAAQTSASQQTPASRQTSPKHLTAVPAGAALPAGPAVDSSPADDASSPDDTSSSPASDDVFWALNGLVDRLGPEGGVTYTGHITPPGAESPVSWQMGLSAEALSEIDFAAAAGALAAFSHPVRLALLQAIYEGTTTVAELSADDRFGTTGQVYHHLKALASAGWLENIPRGHWRVPAQKVIPLLTLILIGTH
ncbi:MULTISPECIES: ArsR/SmtB family transcription factor [Brevibacterium]|uniref:ArsR/SmtB family transcription factor n=1 Tax=Brevibacterium TaxID=1696 RepID=UPI000AB651D9